ncbi:hypothetical protein P7K49_031604 [Saguinus oedipus]|uniref:Uncharacterized protein n=1 Tax=Saguinus oedipus TaxID=9490 RepID=A0ABQ9TZV9_SAGOE|nr:hypothetical protein P7K49_031604 [Saguinus oedipus]
MVGLPGKVSPGRSTPAHLATLRGLTTGRSRTRAPDGAMPDGAIPDGAMPDSAKPDSAGLWAPQQVRLTRAGWDAPAMRPRSQGHPGSMGRLQTRTRPPLARPTCYKRAPELFPPLPRAGAAHARHRQAYNQPLSARSSRPLPPHF